MSNSRVSIKEIPVASYEMKHPDDTVPYIK